MATSTPLSEANAKFSLALFKKLSDEDKTGNIFFSPFSISSALAMVMLGTRGNTATQMSECLKPQDDPNDVHAQFAELLSQLKKTPVADVELNTANRLYGEQSYQFIEDFLKETKKHYDAELKSVDFQSNAEEARITINDWVEEQTKNKIKELLVKGVLGATTKLVLVNAIYFKGKWSEQFKEDSTVDADFRINKNETKSVKMMAQKSKFPINFNNDANCQILEMPYEGKDLSMFIFLPKEIEDDTTGLEKLEKELTYEKFVEWTQNMTSQTEVEVKLPRFKMEEKYDLKDVLTSMGMVDAFDDALSDFSGMSSANDLVLTKVVHKAFVEVNEEGTEAAAATAANISLTSVMERKATFIADHPFLFFIQHKSSKTTLFSGRFCFPE